MNTPRLQELTDAWRDECLTSAEAAELNQLLRGSEAARRFFRAESQMHGLLHSAVMAAAVAETGAHLAPQPAGAHTVARSRPAWFQWRPLAAAAAGLVIGIFGATAVWAFSVVKPPRVQEVALADAGFEAGAPIPSASVPQQSGQWSGDPCAIVEALGRVRPREGRHMLRFLAASTTGDFPGSKNMASDLWQVIALPGSGARTVRIRAWFNADTDKQARFHIAAVAGDDASASAKELWEQRYSEGGSLAFARSMTLVDHDPATWEAGELTLQVPPQARVLVIGIAAYRLPVVPANEWFPAQFVDEVSVSVTEEMLP